MFHPEYELDVSQLNERAILFVAMLGCTSLGQVLCEASLQRWRKKSGAVGCTAPQIHSPKICQRFQVASRSRCERTAIRQQGLGLNLLGLGLGESIDTHRLQLADKDVTIDKANVRPSRFIRNVLFAQ